MKRVSCSLLPFPIFLTCLATITILIITWIYNGCNNLVLIMLLFVCFSTLLLRKGIEINQNSLRHFHGFLGYRKGTFVKYSDNPISVIIYHIVKKVVVSSSKSLLYSNSRTEYYYLLKLITNKENNIEILNSKDYSRILKFAKFISTYYNIPLTTENVNIDFPALGDYTESMGNELKPKTSRKKI